jgi:Raf kinase inhibitor-like YbhB/YbcL family protein
MFGKKMQLIASQPCSRAFAIGFVLVLSATAACRSAPTIGEGTPVLQLTSSSFPEGEIAKKCTCDGANISPQLAWAEPPARTRTFALIVFDQDSLFHYFFVHWVLYDIPADKRELPEGLPTRAQLPDGSRQGQTDFDKIGYGGPCPPLKSEHHYVFRLYALDSPLNLPPGATRKQVEAAAKEHVLAHAELIGRYHR